MTNYVYIATSLNSYIELKFNDGGHARIRTWDLQLRRLAPYLPRTKDIFSAARLDYVPMSFISDFDFLLSTSVSNHESLQIRR